MTDPKALADGLVLQAMSRRHGVPLGWYHRQQVWVRVCIAAQFSAGFAKFARDTRPRVLVIQNDHYERLSPPSGTELPKAWLAEGRFPKGQPEQLAGLQQSSLSVHRTIVSSRVPLVLEYGHIG